MKTLRRYAASATESRFEKRWYLGDIGSTRVAVDRSTPFLLLLLLMTFRFRLFPFFESSFEVKTYWLMATAMTLGVVVSVLLHEVAHVGAVRACGGSARGLVLFLIGATPRSTSEVRGRGRRVAIQLAGSGASLAIASFCLLLYFLAESNAYPRPGNIVLFHLAAANLTLCFFQLLPALSLDGGRAILAASEKNGKPRVGVESALFVVGIAISLGLLAGGISAIATDRPALGTWLWLVGVVLANNTFLEHESLRTAKRLAGNPVREFMNASPVVVPATMRLDHFAALCRGHRHFAFFPVVEGSRLLGLVRPASLDRFLPGEWSTRRVTEILEPCARENTVSPDDDAGAVLSTMVETGVPRCLVIEDGRLAGILSYGLLWEGSLHPRKEALRSTGSPRTQAISRS